MKHHLMYMIHCASLLLQGNRFPFNCLYLQNPALYLLSVMPHSNVLPDISSCISFTSCFSHPVTCVHSLQLSCSDTSSSNMFLVSLLVCMRVFKCEGLDICSQQAGVSAYFSCSHIKACWQLRIMSAVFTQTKLVSYFYVY